MALVSIDWGRDGVVVAYRTGPEQAPAVLVPTGDLELDGGIELRRGSGWVLSTGRPSPDSLARVSAVVGLAADEPLAPRVELPPGTAAGLEADHLLVDGEELGAGELVDRFARTLHDWIVARVKSTPRLLAVLDLPLQQVAVVVEPGLAASARRRLRQALSRAGFGSLELHDRWRCAAAAVTAVPGEPTVVLDWTSEGLDVGALERHPEEPGSTPRLRSRWRLRAVDREHLSGGVRRTLEAMIEMPVLSEEQVRWRDPDEDTLTYVAEPDLERAALDAADRIFGGAASIDVEVAVSTTATSFEDPRPEPLEVRLDESRVRDLLALPLRRARNGLTSIRRDVGARADCAVCVLGRGFLLPGSVAIAALLRPEDLTPERLTLTPALGALRLGPKATAPSLPYDCGVVLRCLADRPRTFGTLVVPRRTPLPAARSSRSLRMSEDRAGTIEVSLYLRKADFATGELTYTTHGLYPIAPAAGKEGEVRLQAEVRVDAELSVDVTIKDLVAGREYRLESMGILGGEPLETLPDRSIDESNGGVMRNAYEALLASSTDERVSAMGRSDVVEFLRSFFEPTESEVPSLFNVALMTLSLEIEPSLAPWSDFDKEELDGFLATGRAPREDMRRAVRRLQSDLLLRLADYVAAAVGGGAELRKLCQLISSLQGLDVLDKKHFQQLVNSITLVVNRAEVASPDESAGLKLAAIKQVQSHLAHFHALALIAE